MQRKTAIGLGLLASVLLLAACAETSDFLVERTHPNGWLNASSADFHGKLVLESARKAASCQTCHGEDFGGGSAEVACASCHAAYPHPDGFRVPSDPQFHEAFFQDNLNWDLTTCQSCHGEAYDGKGGITPNAAADSPKNCLQCHRADDGPEDCSTCHGGDSGNFAPPEALLDGVSTDVPGVGAHQEHLLSQVAAIGLECSHCHVRPDEYGSPGHVLDDDTPGRAELVFGPLATREGTLDVRYDFSTQTCSNSYCHGNFEFSRDSSNFQFAYTEAFMTGENVSVIWNQVGAGQAECGTCHGIPPTGHVSRTLEQCANCHGTVVDSNGEIVDPELHMNGEINVF